MRRLIVFLLFGISCASFLQSVFAAGQSSTHYEISGDAIAQGCGLATGGVYENVSTTGQSAPVGISRGAGYENQSGFWNTILLLPPVPTLSCLSLFMLIIGFGFVLYKKKQRGIVI